MDGSGEARRGVRRDPEPPAGPVIRNTRPLTCPLASLFLTIKAGRWTAPLSPFVHSRGAAGPEELTVAKNRGRRVLRAG